MKLKLELALMNINTERKTSSIVNRLTVIVIELDSDRYHPKWN